MNSKFVRTAQIGFACLLSSCFLFAKPAFAIYPTAEQTHPIPTAQPISPVSETTGNAAYSHPFSRADRDWMAVKNGTFLQPGDASETRVENGATPLKREALKRPDALMVFVSASMPKPLLVRYLKAVGRLGGRMVIRGWVGGNPKQTAEFAKAMGKATGQPVTIDPVAFEYLQVHRVPVIALLDDDARRCLQTEGCNLHTDTYLKLSGDVTIHEALKTFVEKGEPSADAPVAFRVENGVDPDLIVTAKRLLQKDKDAGGAA